MKHILLTIAAACALGVSAQTTETIQVVEARGESTTAEYALTASPKLIIKSDAVVFTDRKTATTFAPTERIVLRIKTKEETITSIPTIANPIPAPTAAATYDLSGRKINTPPRSGIIIQNGRKILSRKNSRP